MADVVTDAEQKEIDRLFDCMTPIAGEVREVKRCRCGRLFGHRYIPGSLGRGLVINVCPMRCVSSGAWDLVEQRIP